MCLNYDILCTFSSQITFAFFLNYFFEFANFVEISRFEIEIKIKIICSRSKIRDRDVYFEICSRSKSRQLKSRLVSSRAYKIFINTNNNFFLIGAYLALLSFLTVLKGRFLGLNKYNSEIHKRETNVYEQQHSFRRDYSISKIKR